MTRALPALVVVVVSAGCGASPSPMPTPSLTATPSATAAVATPSPTPDPPAVVVFEPAEVPTSTVGSAMLAGVTGGDGIVAIGFDGAFGTIAWTTTDGRAWRDVTPADFANVGLASVIESFDLRLVGVGRGNTLDPDANQATVLLSQDGLTWRQPEGAAELEGQLIDVAETDHGFFAVGGRPGADAAGVWHSPDGETWQPIGEELEAAFLWTVAEGGPGLVVGGWRRNPDPDAAIWTSADAGTTWELAPDPEGAELAEITGLLAVDGGGLIAVGGSITGEEGRIWTSPDGLAWSLAIVEGGLAGATPRSLVPTPIGVLAVGAIGTDAAAWLSTDAGATWTPFGEPVPDAYFTGGVATDAGLVLLGATQTGTQETGIEAHAAAWIATLGE